MIWPHGNQRAAESTSLFQTLAATWAAPWPLTLNISETSLDTAHSLEMERFMEGHSQGHPLALVLCWVGRSDPTLGPELHATCSEISTQPPQESPPTHLSAPCKCGCYSQPRLLDTGHQHRGRICPQATHFPSAPASWAQWENSLFRGAADMDTAHRREQG